jgi:aryl-alcohol dehydrogenase-like predicted oxidoreductase
MGWVLEEVSLPCASQVYAASVEERSQSLAQDEALPLIKAAYDVGVNFFDTANVYS